MSQLNDGEKSSEWLSFFQLVSRKIELRDRMMQTPEAGQAIQASDDLSSRILEVIDSAETIEKLIHYEMILQNLDRLFAQSQQEQNSIDNAQREYRQLSDTVAQMRRNPEEYFQANIAFRETGRDFRKLPRGRIQHIHSNITRLRNRATFAPEEDRMMWEARIKLADKTIDVLRSMHRSLVKKYDGKMDM